LFFSHVAYIKDILVMHPRSIFINKKLKVWPHRKNIPSFWGSSNIQQVHSTVHHPEI
jgi:hypothetical protein